MLRWLSRFAQASWYKIGEDTLPRQRGRVGLSGPGRALSGPDRPTLPRESALLVGPNNFYQPA